MQNRIHLALEDLIKAASEALGGDRTGLMDAIMDARSAARAPLTVKPLTWREIDPNYRFVGTGLGFTCEVHILHKGGWEAIWPGGKMDFPTRAEAQAAVEAAYAETIWACIT
jgi:hypothetical protein